MNTKKRYNYNHIAAFCWFILLMVACTSSPDRVEHSLQLSGANRSELEKVLEFYSKSPSDSLKLRAAKFLIENMPGHHSYKDTMYYKQYYIKIDSVAEIYKDLGLYERELMFKDIIEKHSDRPLDIIPDNKVLSSDYLIDNIERAFKVWQESAWAEHVDFKKFCEYILPYKIQECQELDNWREYFEFYCDGELRELQYCDLYRNSAYKACETVNEALDQEIEVRMFSSYDTTVKKLSSMTNMAFGLCHDYNMLAVSVMRAKGIPCAIDFTPQWPFRSLGHSWCILLKNTGRHVLFEGIVGKPAAPHKEDHKMAKVFRYTYAINDELMDMHSSEMYIPSSFKTVCMEDVSDEYMETIDIEISVDLDENFKYAYLAVFDNANWVPVQWGKIDNGKVTFPKMGKNIVYLPVLYMGRIQPLDDPFLVTTNGEIIPIKPDTLAKQEMILSRKFPPFPGIYEVGRRVIGGRIEAANNPGFNNPDTIHTITEYGLYSKEIRLDSIEKKYRYWRYYPPEDAFCNLAEMYFFEKDSVNSTIGRVIGTNGSFRSEGGYTKEAVFDRDILTFFDAPQADDCWVGMDFGKPVDMERIVYFPRSDGNCIEIGDEYELFYWSNNNWQSLGKKVGEGGDLTYVNCPEKALFLLHDHTKGAEERIFMYEEGKQIWW